MSLEMDWMARAGMKDWLLMASETFGFEDREGSKPLCVVGNRTWDFDMK
jgi:hypothetical protein